MHAGVAFYCSRQCLHVPVSVNRAGKRPTHALAKTHLLRQGVDDPHGEGTGEAELRAEQQRVEM